MTRTLTITHEGVTYSGQAATIKSTMFGIEDHGILTAYLNLEWPGAGVGFGGYCLDAPHHDPNGKFTGRVGTAYGLDFLTAVMHTVGVSRWEHLPGRQVILLFEGPNAWGSSPVGIAHHIEDRVFIPADHLAAHREQESRS